MTDKEYLDKAIELIIALHENGDIDASFICEELCEHNDEQEVCANYCNGLDRFCVLRFLKYFKKK